MKRSLSLIVLAAICVLALAAVTSLSGCSTKAPDNDPTGSIDSPDPAPAVTGETATYTSGYVDMALDLPEGWSWEQVSDNGTDKTEGIRFYKTDDPTVSYTLLCWTGGYGICGTGVTSEEITLANGMKVWQHTEESDDGLWLNLYFESVPGDYVCAPSGTLTKEMWDGCRDEVLAILGTAQFGRDAMTEQAAIDDAAAQYDGQYDMAYGRYSVVDGCWTVTFSKGAAGENSESFKITPQGSVTAAE